MSKIELTPLAKRKFGAAQAALKASMRVVALQPRSKVPDTRFCASGADSATEEALIVKQWLSEDPSINLGAVAKASPVLIIDVDGPEGEAALKRFGPLPPTRETITRNGRHLYFHHAGRIRGSKIGLEPKLDIIASGYVLLPESAHPEGGRYRSDEPAAPIAKLPGRVLNAILARSRSPKPKKAQASDGVIRKGSRDNRLTSLAGSFRRQGFDDEVIATALHAVNEAHCSPPLPDKDIERIASSVMRYDPADDELFETMANVTPRDVDFLWEPYFVRGAINLLEGDPNVGKTFLFCELAAAVSSGRGLPGQKKPRAANVLFMSAEDDPETTLVRRLMRMNADLSRITFSKKFFRLEEEALGWIEKHIIAQKAELLILDPLLAYMQGGIDMNKANETRPFMARLAELAKATNVTVIALRHLTKGEKDKAIFRGLGSVDITAAARSAVLIGQHPENDDLRVMVHIKHNLSERGPSQIYALVDGDRNKRIIPKVEWQGECELGPEDFLKSSEKVGRPDTEIKAAIEFLETALAKGERRIAEVIADGEKRSHSARTVRRAAKSLGVIKLGQRWKLANIIP